MNEDLTISGLRKRRRTPPPKATICSLWKPVWRV